MDDLTKCKQLRSKHSLLTAWLLGTLLHVLFLAGLPARFWAVLGSVE